MITFKQAIEAARVAAREMFGDVATDVEEIEVEDYHGKNCWAITMSIYRDGPPHIVELVGKGALAKDYKRFFIERESGEVLGVVIRELKVA
jgi:hypothetical protein